MGTILTFGAGVVVGAVYDKAVRPVVMKGIAAAKVMWAAHKL